MSAWDELPIQGGSLTTVELPVGVVPWDESKPYTDRPGDLAGCPPGSGVIYGTPSWWDALLGRPYTRGCQTVEEATAPVIRAETGPGVVDQVTISVADSLQKIKDALPSGWDLSLLLLAGVAIVAVVVLRR